MANSASPASSRPTIEERFLQPLRPVLFNRTFMLAVKSGVAAGLAFFVGAWLPGSMGEYAYYAALGAISVIYPAVSDSIRESARATAALVLGAAIAGLMQWIAWPNALTVAIVVLVAVSFSGLRFLGDQRHWVATAALFVLVFSGDPPQQYIIIYLAQILTGAVVGIAINAAVPLLNLTSLSRAIETLRTQLVHQLRGVARQMDEGGDPSQEDLDEVFNEIERDRDALRAALEEVERSRQGNPRARRYDRSRELLREHAHALARIGFLLQDVGVVLQDAYQERMRLVEGQVRTATVAAFADLADLLESPSPEAVDRAEESVNEMVHQVGTAQYASKEARYLGGVLAASAQLALSTAATHLAPQRLPEGES